MKQEHKVKDMLDKIEKYVKKSSNPVFVRNLKVAKKVLMWVLKNE